MAPAGYCVQPFSSYECPGNGFTGCCTTDPCALSWCPDFPEPSIKFPLQFGLDGSSPSIAPSASMSKVASSTSMPRPPATTPTPAEPTKSAETIESEKTTKLASKLDVAPMPTSTSTFVLVHQTSNVYVSAKMEPTTKSMTLYSSPLYIEPITVSSTLTSFRTHTMTMSSAATQPHSAQATEAASPIAPYAQRHKWAIIGSTVGVFFGLGIAAALIILCLNWERKRRFLSVQAQTMRDHPSMAGKDANQAGKLFGKFLNKTRGHRHEDSIDPIFTTHANMASSRNPSRMSSLRSSNNGMTYPSGRNVEIAEQFNQTQIIPARRSPNRSSSDSTTTPELPALSFPPPLSPPGYHIYGNAPSSTFRPIPNRSASSPTHRTTPPRKSILRSSSGSGSGSTTIASPERLIENAQIFDRLHYGNQLNYGVPLALPDLPPPSSLSETRHNSISHGHRTRTRSRNPSRRHTSHRKTRSMDCPSVDEGQEDDNQPPPPTAPSSSASASLRPAPLSPRNRNRRQHRHSDDHAHPVTLGGGRMVMEEMEKRRNEMQEADSRPVHGPFEMGQGETGMRMKMEMLDGEGEGEGEGESGKRQDAEKEMGKVETGE